MICSKTIYILMLNYYIKYLIKIIKGVIMVSVEEFPISSADHIPRKCISMDDYMWCAVDKSSLY